jgi:predicted esterase
MNPARAQVTRQDLGFAHVIEPGPSADTLLLLHSTGGDEHQLVGLGRQLAPRATLLSPRGKVLENGLIRRFFARNSALELDIPDLLTRTDELAEFVQSAVGAYELEPDRVIALGYSNGANIAVSMLLRHPALLAGAALLRPTLPYEPDTRPALDGARVLVASGSHDPYAAAGATQRLVEVLRGAGADVSFELADTGHELLEADLVATQRWLTGVLGESKP